MIVLYNIIIILADKLNDSNSYGCYAAKGTKVPHMLRKILTLFIMMY